MIVRFFFSSETVIKHTKMSPRFSACFFSDQILILYSLLSYHHNYSRMLSIARLKCLYFTRHKSFDILGKQLGNYEFLKNNGTLTFYCRHSTKPQNCVWNPTTESVVGASQPDMYIKNIPPPQKKRKKKGESAENDSNLTITRQHTMCLSHCISEPVSKLQFSKWNKIQW